MSPPPAIASPRPHPAAGALRAVAFALLMASAASRCLLGEMPYRTSAIPDAALRVQDPSSPADPIPPDRTELARVTFALLLLSAVALWLIAGSVEGRLVVRRPGLAGLILLFAVLAAMSVAFAASSKRDGIDVALEQVSMLGACFLAVQLCSAEEGSTSRRRFALLVVVLAGLGATLAVKGLYQAAVETPQQTAYFQAHRQMSLQQINVQPGSPQERMMEVRLADPAPTGYFGLSNEFASLLIVLLAAAATVAFDRIVSAARSRRLRPKDRPANEVHLPTVAAVIAVLAAATVAVVLALTRSRGGIAAAVVAAVAAVLIYRRRRTLALRRGAALWIAGIVLALLLAGAAGYGLARDRLPTKTMTFRWYYWTAAAKIIADHPLLGVGPGNFGTAYLQVRRAVAEEAVKMPHNFILHALAQFGLPGGLCFLAILAAVLVGLTRPRPAPPEEDASPGREGGVAGFIVVVVLVAVAARGMLSAAAMDAQMFLIEAVLPAAVLAVLLTAAAWNGQRLSAAMDDASVRILLACGVAGMVLHNFVTCSLWFPASATVFWVSAGGLLGRAGGERQWNLRGGASLLSVLALAGLAVLAAFVWYPVCLRTIRTEQSIATFLGGDVQVGAQLAEQAYEADVLDPIAAADASRARFFAATLTTLTDEEARSFVFSRSLTWAKRAIQADPENYAYRRLAAGALWQPTQGGPPPEGLVKELLHHMDGAVKRNPMDSRLRLDYANILLRAGKNPECLAQLRAAGEINDALNPESIHRFNPREQEEITAMKDRASRP